MSLQRPSQQGSASSRSQQVYHSCWVSQGTSGFSGRSWRGEKRARATVTAVEQDGDDVGISMHIRNAATSISLCLSVYLSVCLSHLLNSGSPSEEEVPLWVCDLPRLPHDLGAQHEGEHQLVLLKETPVHV